MASASAWQVELKSSIGSTRTMAEYPSQDEFSVQAQRLLRYRIPLLLALLINFALVVRVPLGQMRAAADSQTAGQVTQAADLAAVADPMPEQAPREDVTPQVLQVETREIDPPDVDVVADFPLVIPEPAPSVRGPASAPVDAPELQIVLPPRATSGQPQAPLDPARPSAAPPLSLSLSSVDLARATKGWTSSWHHVRDYWENSLERSTHHQSDIDQAATVADEPIEVEVPPLEETASAPTATEPPQHLELENPSDSGGSVRFLIDGRLCTLLAGESHRFSSDVPHCVRFHRGGDNGDEEISLTGGRFQFSVTDEGWKLVPVE